MIHSFAVSLLKQLVNVGRPDGKARAAKYGKATLSKWAKKGGRPPKEGKRDGN